MAYKGASVHRLPKRAPSGRVVGEEVSLDRSLRRAPSGEWFEKEFHFVDH